MEIISYKAQQGEFLADEMKNSSQSRGKRLKQACKRGFRISVLGKYQAGSTNKLDKFCCIQVLMVLGKVIKIPIQTISLQKFPELLNSDLGILSRIEVSIPMSVRSTLYLLRPLLVTLYQHPVS